MDSYIKYENNLEEEKDFTDIVAIVNVGSNKNWYEKTKKTNIKREMNKKYIMRKNINSHAFFIKTRMVDAY